MKKELLEERIKLIETQMAKLQADYNALAGAKTDCEYWLSTLPVENPVEKSEESVDAPEAA